MKGFQEGPDYRKWEPYPLPRRLRLGMVIVLCASLAGIASAATGDDPVPIGNDCFIDDSPDSVDPLGNSLAVCDPARPMTPWEWTIEYTMNGPVDPMLPWLESQKDNKTKPTPQTCDRDGCHANAPPKPGCTFESADKTAGGCLCHYICMPALKVYR